MRKLATTIFASTLLAGAISSPSLHAQGENRLLASMMNHDMKGHKTTRDDGDMMGMMKMMNQMSRMMDRCDKMMSKHEKSDRSNEPQKKNPPVEPEKKGGE